MSKHKWNMNTGVNLQPKSVGYETVANYIAIFFVNLVDYIIKFKQKKSHILFQCIYNSQVPTWEILQMSSLLSMCNVLSRPDKYAVA